MLNDSPRDDDTVDTPPRPPLLCVGAAHDEECNTRRRYTVDAVGMAMSSSMGYRFDESQQSQQMVMQHSGLDEVAAAENGIW
jgi:hypothetical protein